MQSQLLTTFENPGRIVRPQRAVMSFPINVEADHPARRDEETLVCKVLLIQHLQQASSYKDPERESQDEQQRTSDTRQMVPFSAWRF